MIPNRFVVLAASLALATTSFADKPLAELPDPAGAKIQIQANTKIIRGSAAVVPHGKTLTPAAMEARLAELKSGKDWDLLSVPSVVTMEGSEATVSMGSEVVRAPGEDPAFVGMSLTLVFNRDPGGILSLSAHVVNTELLGEEDKTAPPMTFEQKIDLPVTPGHTVSLVVPTKDPAHLLTFLITPKIVGKAGDPLPEK